MSNTYDIHIPNPDGGDFSACLALPADKTPAPAIIVIQEIFGLNHDVRSKCQAWADKGYVAIAPDLFWRQEHGVQLTDKTQAEWEQAFALLKGFDVDKGVFDLDITLAHIRSHSACNGTVGAVGYCLGGKLAYLMAERTDIDVAVSYYGVGLGALIPEQANIKKPLLMHMAEGDKFVSPDEQAVIRNGVAQNPQITLYSYPHVNHAFSRVNGEHYDQAAADLANGRTTDFIKRYL